MSGRIVGGGLASAAGAKTISAAGSSVVGGGCSPLSTSPPFAAASSCSPLQRFVRAKARINSVYEEIQSYMSDVNAFLGGSSGRRSPLEEEDDEEKNAVVERDTADRVLGYGRQVEAIRQVLSRDHMKVVFFGRTSNGKSTFINALLGDRILPTGIGHTTSCFLQVEGGDEAFLLLDGSSKRLGIASVSQLGSALSAEKLEAGAKVRVVWPKERCKMLGEEVVIIDSPGIDVETDLDAWIDSVCLDSDVFVLVANAESTLMLTEKRFFHRVSERLSKPNIFVVHNRSDAFAGEEAAEEVRAQHTERAVTFLVDELRVCAGRGDAEERIFFISAKEALAARLREPKAQPHQVEGSFERYLEFQEFERRFTDCLSRAAVSTKFAQHSRRGAQVVRDVAAVMADVNARATVEHRRRTLRHEELRDRRDFVTKQLELMTVDMKAKICAAAEDVERKVGRAMGEEIRRLSLLVDEFDDPFHPDPLVTNVYKSRLNQHIEAGIGSNLRSRLSSDLQINVESHEREMIDGMTALLLPSAEHQHSCRNMLPRRGDAFEVLYHLHFDSLCADFQEDVRFRFSLGFDVLFRRFLGGRRRGAGEGNVDDDWSKAAVAAAAVSSQGTMGGLVVAGLLLKAVGWRAVLASSAVYAGVYLYERLTWTNNAKCREFKRQYVEHAARKLRLVVDMTSANCSHQVQQELSSTFARLCRLVDETTVGMQDGIDRIERSLARMDDTAGRSKVLRNQASFIASKLEQFDRSFIRVED